MKNRYEQSADALILQKKQITLHNIVNRKGEPASWDDVFWKLSDNSGRQVSVSFHNITAINKNVSVIPISAQYDDTIRHLIMCFTLDIQAETGISLRISNNVTNVRHLLARVDLLSLTQDKLNQLYKDHNDASWLNSIGFFIKWCKKQGVVRESLAVPSLSREPDTNMYIKRKAEKMPDERGIWMIGAIRNEIIPKVVTKCLAEYEPNLLDALVISCATIALGSPQRLVAEQFTLDKQLLQSKEVIFEGEKKEVHWLNWTGSKKYVDNRKHFFDVMSEYISEVLDYWWQVGEPARILCRFYEDPSQPLNLLLGDYEPKNINGFDLSKSVNMFTLGFILGFYETTEQSVCVTLSATHELGRSDIKKLIRHLMPTDHLSVIKYSQLLFGQQIIFQKREPDFEACFKGVLTVAEIQKRWIKHIKQHVPTFPYRIVGENKVKLSNALFIMTGKQFTTPHSIYPLRNSFYAIESANLGSIVAKQLKAPQKGEKNIFVRYGFSSDIGVSPHHLRHWSNTKMQESGLSDEVIAAVSGRVDVNQNAVYDHTNESDKIALMSSLVSKGKSPEEMKKEVRVVGHREYQDLTGKISTITATGICTQNLTTSPCTYLSDFVSHCALCSSSCHFSHDEKAIGILKKDLMYQQVRLDKVKSDPKLNTNTVLQRWFTVHFTNTAILEQLIELMMHEDIAIGSAIRYVKDNNAFRITDLKKRTVKDVKALLPDSKSELECLLKSVSDNNDSPKSANIELDNLLSRFGIQGTL